MTGVNAAQIPANGLVLYRRVFNGVVAKIHEVLDNATLVPTFNTERYENPRGFCSITITSEGIPGVVRIVGTAAKVFVIANSARGAAMYSKRVAWPGDLDEVNASVTAIVASARTAVKTLERTLATASAPKTLGARGIASLVGGRAVTAAPQSTAEDFAKSLISENTGDSEATRAACMASLALEKAVIAVIPKFDGKTGYAKRLCDALKAEIEPKLHTMPDLQVLCYATKDYAKRTEVNFELRRGSRVVAAHTISVKSAGDALDAASVIDLAKARIENARKELDKLASTGNPEKVHKAAVVFFNAFHDLAKELGCTGFDLVNRLRSSQHI